MTEKTAIFWFYLLTITLSINGQRQHNNGEKGVIYNQIEVERGRQFKSKEIQKYMNLNADPCSDFYEFACGMWNKIYEREDGKVISQDDLLEQRTIDTLQLLLEKPIPGQVPLIRNFYTSCLQAESEHQYYTTFVNSNGGLPDLAGTKWNPQNHWESLVGNLRFKYGMEILIGINIEPSTERGGGYSLFLDEPVLTILPPELCSAEAIKKVESFEQFYNDVQGEVAKNLGNWFRLRETETERIAGDIVSFEVKLCEQIRKDQLIEDEEPAGMSHGRFQNNQQNQYLHLNAEELTKQFGRRIDFVSYFNAIYPHQFGDQVFLRSVAYFRNLAELLRNTTDRTLVNYIMYNAMLVLSFPNKNNRKDRAKFCTELTMRYFPQHLGEMFYTKYNNEEAKKDIENMYQRISDAFRDSFDVDWMTKKLQLASRQKLWQFKVRFLSYDIADLQFPTLDNSQSFWKNLDRIMRYKADKELSKLFKHGNRQSERVVDAYEVDMGLETRENELQIGLGYLQPPLYHLNFYGSSLKYSVLGQDIASKLVSAIDEQGWDKYSQSTMKWDEQTLDGFQNITQCFRTQYSHYLYNNPDEFRNAAKLREFIADSSGLNIAFKAYLMWLHDMDTRDKILKKETLSDVNFTNTQLFFIHFAQARCATTNSSGQENTFPMDLHTEERFSVNGPLSNFNEFAREFNCAPGSQMNSDDKCILF